MAETQAFKLLAYPQLVQALFSFVCFYSSYFSPFA